MAIDTSIFGEDSDTINIDLNGLMNSSMSANGLTYQDLYSITTPGSNLTYTTTGTGANNPWIAVNDHSTLSVQGDADFGGDVRVQGRSLAEFMQQVEQRLNILQPNPEMEAEWDQLRELGEQYRRLEQELEAKAEMWNRLKK
jgi:hypothetical protein